MRDYLSSSAASPFSHVVRSYAPSPSTSASHCRTDSSGTASCGSTGSEDFGLPAGCRDVPPVSQQTPNCRATRSMSSAARASQRPGQVPLRARSPRSGSRVSAAVGETDQSPLQIRGRRQRTATVDQRGSCDRASAAARSTVMDSRLPCAAPAFTEPNKQVSDSSVSTSAESLLHRSGSLPSCQEPGFVQGKSASLDSVPSPACLPAEDESTFCSRESALRKKPNLFEDVRSEVGLRRRASIQHGSPGEEGPTHAEGSSNCSSRSSCSRPYVWLRADQVSRRLRDHPDLGLYGEVVGPVLLTVSPASIYRALLALSEALEPIERAYVVARAAQRVRLAMRKSTDLMAELAVGELGSQHWCADVCVAVRSPLNLLVPLGRGGDDKLPGHQRHWEEAPGRNAQSRRRAGDIRGGAGTPPRWRQRERNPRDRDSGSKLPRSRLPHCEDTRSSQGQGHDSQALRARRSCRTYSFASGNQLGSLAEYDGFLVSLGVWVFDSQILLPVPCYTTGGAELSSNVPGERGFGLSSAPSAGARSEQGQLWDRSGLGNTLSLKMPSYMTIFGRSGGLPYSPAVCGCSLQSTGRAAEERPGWGSQGAFVLQEVELGTHLCHLPSASRPTSRSPSSRDTGHRRDETTWGTRRSVDGSRVGADNLLPFSVSAAPVPASSPAGCGLTSQLGAAASGCLSTPPYDRYAVLCSGLSVSRVHSCVAFLYRVYLCCCDRCLFRACIACHCSCRQLGAADAFASPASAPQPDECTEDQDLCWSALEVGETALSRSSVEVFPEHARSVLATSCCSADKGGDTATGNYTGRLRTSGTERSASKRCCRGVDNCPLNGDKLIHVVGSTVAPGRSTVGQTPTGPARASSCAFGKGIREGGFGRRDYKRGELAVFLLHYACFRFCGDVCHWSARLAEQRHLPKLRALFQDDSPRSVSGFGGAHRGEAIQIL